MKFRLPDEFRNVYCLRSVVKDIRLEARVARKGENHKERNHQVDPRHVAG
jgi:hypothetical protein